MQRLRVWVSFILNPQMYEVRPEDQTVFNINTIDLTSEVLVSLNYLIISTSD